MHRGAWAPRYWSSPGCLFHHAYPVGYRASKAQFGRSFSMSISPGATGPVFQARAPALAHRVGPSDVQPSRAPVIHSSFDCRGLEGALILAPLGHFLAYVVADSWKGVCRLRRRPAGGCTLGRRRRNRGRRSVWRIAPGSASQARPRTPPLHGCNGVLCLRQTIGRTRLHSGCLDQLAHWSVTVVLRVGFTYIRQTICKCLLQGRYSMDSATRLYSAR